MDSMGSRVIETLDIAIQLPAGRRDWKSTQEAKDLFAAVKTVTEWSLFENTLQELGWGCKRFDRKNLVTWMVNRARNVGAVQTVSEVDAYVRCDEFTVYHVMLLTGLLVHGRYDIGNNMWLVGSSDLPTEGLQQLIKEDGRNMLPIPDIASALVCEIQQPKQHFRQEELDSRRPTDLPTQALKDAYLCLTLDLPKGLGVQSVAITTVASDSTPSLGGLGWYVQSYRTLQHPCVYIDETGAAKARKLTEAFAKLADGRQAALRIPIQKLNEFASGNDIVQRAIDLRTAIESIYLDDDVRGEMNYRLCLRAALFAESEPNARRRVRKYFSDAYDLGSAAVHNGDIPAKTVRKKGKSLDVAAKIARTALIRIIESGGERVKWDELELGVLPTNDTVSD